jgi:hypothetical protein
MQAICGPWWHTATVGCPGMRAGRGDRVEAPFAASVGMRAWMD